MSGDLPEHGPGFYARYASDARLARKKLKTSAFRLGIEWSRVFPTSTESVDVSGGITLATLQALDALADQAAVAHYRAVLTALRDEGLSPFVTLVHFALPLWLHDPIAVRDALAGSDPSGAIPPIGAPAGWLEPVIVTELEKYAAYLGWKLGDLADRWAPLNEPIPMAAGGYVNIAGIIGTFFHRASST